MSKRGVGKKVPGKKATARKAKVGYPPAPWHVVYFKRERRNDPAETRAGKVFLNDECPPSIRAELLAIVKAVADTPPPAFSGGGKWEAMKADMAGYYQAKADGFEAGGRKHWRLFCRTERDSVPGLPGPSVVIITGLVKPYLTLFTAQEYEAVTSISAPSHGVSRCRLARHRALAPCRCRATGRFCPPKVRSEADFERPRDSHGDA